jgi:hypothetical protein
MLSTASDWRHCVVRDCCDAQLMPSPPSAESLVSACGNLNDRITRDLGGDPMKMPFWRLHLPSGGVFTIKLIGVEGPFVRFVGFWATASIVDYVLAAPESVVITIESSDELAEPLEIELPGE